MPKKGIGIALLAICGGMLTAAPPAAAEAKDPASNPCRALSAGVTKYQAGRANHVLFAIAPEYGSTEVSITECAKKGRRWKRVLTASGYVGKNGFAAPGTKKEGDGKSPTGMFTLTEAFGEGDPGTSLPYRKLRDGGECWGSTIGDARYNRYYPGTCLPDDENLSDYMHQGPYRQAVVINYNRPPDSPIVQGAGSAIFLHVSRARPTAGCVATDQPTVEAIMKTLRPHDRIIMGPREALFHV
ncbi:L,D-transpeptidase family protein [Spirillospora sp. CA-294931]|uniref:L,D-transpeptidase family protein n=1 Tax=Spirillospora sp. CA-294931 TaxID=3240042 RepID=UPI003D935BAF